MSVTHKIFSWGSLLAVVLASCTGSNDVEVGSLKVSVTTTGSKPDADGYLVVIGQKSGEPIAADGDLTIPELLPGDYPAKLSGVAANCFVVGPNPLTVKVTAGAQATASFEVSCPGAGARVRVTTVATGGDLDPDGYLLKIGTSGSRVPAQGVITLSLDQEGALPVELTDVAPNCTPDPANPSTLTIASGTETPLTLKVACTAVTGSVKVTVATSGADVQQEGFGVSVGVVNRILGTSKTTTVTGLAPGTLAVALDAFTLKANCQVQGESSRSATVTIGATTEVTFNVACAALAHVVVSATTLGLDLDTDGYQVTLVSDDYYDPVTYRFDIASSGTTQGPALPPGTYYAYVTGAGANCIVESAVPKPIHLGGADVTLNVTVQCDRAHQLAFVAGEGNASEIWVGSETGVRTLLTNNTVADSNPAWSPDGTRLAFASTRNGNSEIYVMNADGSNVLRLTNNAVADYQPTWSFDGSRIAFVSQRDGNPEIYVMAADGSNPVRLTNDAGSDTEPAWSPTGDRILFVSTRAPAAGAIYVMNADGTGVARLTAQALPERSPTWSASSGQIAYARFGTFGAYTLQIMNADGSNPQEQFITTSPSTRLSWAPNARVALTQPSGCDGLGCSSYAVSVRRSDGTVVQLPWTASSEPAWRP